MHIYTHIYIHISSSDTRMCTHYRIQDKQGEIGQRYGLGAAVRVCLCVCVCLRLCVFIVHLWPSFACNMERTVSIYRLYSVSFYTIRSPLSLPHDRLYLSLCFVSSADARGILRAHRCGFCCQGHYIQGSHWRPQVRGSILAVSKFKQGR